MKSKALLVFSMVAVAIAAGCTKDETASRDEDLAGINVAVGETSGPYQKLFVLNEGKKGTNNATLDFFRFSDGNYVQSSFRKMNPTVTGGLGDTGNDLKIDKDKAWAVLNGGPGLVEVLSAKDETHIATISIPTPRNIAFDKDYAYVSSWSGAYYGGADRKGAVVRVKKGSYEVVDSVTVGYQPEGIEVHDGKIYVACGGGAKSDYSYDDRIFVLDAKTFKPTDTITVAKNLKDIFIDSKGNGWVTAMGDFFSIHSGVYKFLGDNAESCNSTVSDTPVRFSCATLSEGASGSNLYIIGTEDEWVWDPKAEKNWKLYTVNTGTGAVAVEDFTPEGAALGPRSAVLYGICVNGSNGDLYIGDAGDYLAPGPISCYSQDLRLKWMTTAGVDPGHMALYRK